jgi:hypothetical protein
LAGTTRVTVTLKVAYGPAARIVFHVASSIVAPDNAVILAVIAALETITRGKAIQIEISLQAAIAGSPASGIPYVSEDKGLFRFRDVNGVSHAQKVAGILPAIVATNAVDLITNVNPGLAYVNAVTTNAKTRNNETLSSFVSGHRTENRKPIKAGTVS